MYYLFIWLFSTLPCRDISSFKRSIIVQYQRNIYYLKCSLLLNLSNWELNQNSKKHLFKYTKRLQFKKKNIYKETYDYLFRISLLINKYNLVFWICVHDLYSNCKSLIILIIELIKQKKSKKKRAFKSAKRR